MRNTRASAWMGMAQVLACLSLLAAGLPVLATRAAAQEERQLREPAGSLEASTQTPVPLVNQPVVPDAARPGGAGFTLTVNGVGFVNGATVLWNGSPRRTRLVSQGKLAATIKAQDIAVAGTASVSVLNPGSSNERSNVIFFSITNPTRSVRFAGSSFSAGNPPLQVAVGDFNHDGKLDVAVVNFNCPNFVCNPQPGSVYIFLGKGDGTFQERGNFTVGIGPTFAVTGDFNRDGKLDLATTNSSDNTVSVLLGNGDGTFQPATAYPVGTGPTALAAADFNGDGNLDLVTNNNSDNTVSVLLGNGDGTFQTHVDYATATQPQGVTVGDYNGDGKIDLAVNDVNCVNYPTCGTGMVSILLGNGDGTFQAHVDYSTGPSPDTVAAADFNGDGILDLVTTTGTFGTNNTVSVLLGNGDGTFQPSVSYTAGTGTSFVALGDFNGDGKIDMAVTNITSNTVSILLGTGHGTFQPHLDFPAGTAANGIAAGDFNGDGRLDLVVADISSANNVFVLLGH